MPCPRRLRVEEAEGFPDGTDGVGGLTLQIGDGEASKRRGPEI